MFSVVVGVDCIADKTRLQRQETSSGAGNNFIISNNDNLCECFFITELIHKHWLLE